MRDEPGILNIRITTGTVIKTVFVLLLFFIFYRLSDLVLIILTSIVLAAAVEPATRWFAKYKLPRIPAVLIVYLVAFAIVVGLFSLFIPPLVTEVNQGLTKLPQYLETLNISNVVTSTGAPAEVEGGITNIISSVRSALGGLENGLTGIIFTVFGGVFNFVIIIVLSFYLAVQEGGINEFLRLVTPINHRRHAIDLWRRTQFKIGRWMQGQILLSVIIAVLAYLGLTILGVQYALLLALLAGVFELIPIFGPVLSAVPGIALGFMNGISFIPTGGFAAGLAVALFYLLIQQFENHLIYPLVVRKVVGVPPIIVIIALIVGGELAGFLGIILAVPVAAGIMELAADIQKERDEEEKTG